MFMRQHDSGIEWEPSPAHPHLDSFVATTIATIAALAPIIAGGAAAAASTYGAHAASSANTKAARLQASATDKALTYQEQQDALNRTQYMAEYQRQLDLQNQQLAVDAARRANVNAVLQGGANGKLRDLLGLGPAAPMTNVPAPASPFASTAPPMPAGWKPGDPIPGATTPTGPTVPAPTTMGTKPTTAANNFAAASAQPWMNPAAGSLSSLAGVGAPSNAPGPATPVPAIGSMPTYAAPAVIRPPMNLSQLAMGY